MNMKKTMAAIAAGAVAVSAMATTVSAATLDAKTITYNLVRTEKTETTAKVKLTAKFYNVPLEDGMTATFGIKNLERNDIVRISGVYIEDNKQIVPIVATKDQGAEGIWSLATDRIMTPGASGTVVVPVVANNTANGVALMGGDDENAPAQGAQAAVSHSDASITLGTVPAAATKANCSVSVSGAEDACLLQTGSVTLVYDGTAWKAGTATFSGTVALKDGSNAAVTPAQGDEVTFTVDTAAVKAKAATDATGEKKMVSANITVEVTKNIPDNSYGAKDEANNNADINLRDGIDKVNKEINSTTSVLGVSLVTTGGTNNYNNLNPTDMTASDYEKSSKVYQFPYKSSLNNYLYKATGLTWDTTGGDAEGGDVLNHIYEVKTDDTSAKINPISVQAVINDAIAKHGEVTFTFNTATKPVILEDGWYKGTPVGSYTENTWDNSKVGDYRSFANHYYNANQAGYDPNTTYILNNWLGDNLFNGTLIVNSNLTLALNDTQKFDWTATSLSFTWEAIQDQALTTNQYANYIQNMVLRTSGDWYWDNMQVTFGETEVEEVESGAPVEGDVEDLPEDEEETDLGGDVEEEEEEEEEEESEPTPEVAPAVESNPGTGNAPVALAVIPVALAAAAIVAKKRG